MNKSAITGGKVDNTTIAKAVFKVDGNAESILAWSWGFCSKRNMQSHRDDPNSVLRVVIEEVSPNEHIVATAKRFPFSFRKQLLINTVVWSGPSLNDGSYLLCWEPYKGKLSGYVDPAIF